MRFTLTIGALFVAAGTAPTQYPTRPYPASQGPYGYGYGQAGPYAQPGFGPNGYALVMPNICNPQTQPLSPYLNLFRGSNPATNYYYGVRPGTVGSAGRATGGAPSVSGGGNRMLFFPQLAAAPDPLQAAAPGPGQQGPGDVLPPAGHPVVFNNTMGFFPSAFGQAGGARPGLAGIGASRGRR